MERKLKDWIMYQEIKRLLAQGSSQREVALTLGLNRRTVKKYAGMTEAGFEKVLTGRQSKIKRLDSYEAFVRDRLLAAPAASTAQVLDWLKEHHCDLPPVSARTVYNFVMGVRQKYQIPLEEAPREYFLVEELPYGQQAQADFGQYILYTVDKKRKKIYFFVMMLSRSRMKFVQFSDRPFTSSLAVDAHEAAFAFFEGITYEVVYDQDRLFLVDERMGELLLTHEFKSYVAERSFHLHFCRKADPQSKGKVENVVKYVKQNFLYGRVYHDPVTLQAEVLGWLERTGNGMPHSTTRKIPLEEWQHEKGHLRPWIAVKPEPVWQLCTVRKDHTFSYKGNFYSVPQGTYQKGVQVRLTHIGDEVHIHDGQGVLLCKHPFTEGRGHKVINRNHKRDRSASIDQLITATAARFADPAGARQYLEAIRKQKGRYIRDHVQAIAEAISQVEATLVSSVLDTCIRENYLSATLFRELLHFRLQEAQKEIPDTALAKVILLDPHSARKAAIQPDTSSLDTYEQAFRNA
jgi:transposase